MAARDQRPILAVTQGDPAGVGPETLCTLAATRHDRFQPVLIAERAALEQAIDVLPASIERPEFAFLDALPTRDELARVGGERVAVLDPVGERRRVTFGTSGPLDAGAALACLDAGIEMAQRKVSDALVTAPVSKLSIATHALPGFRGHTDYLAAACGLEEYGRDYLMAFLSPDLQVSLVTTHLPLAEAMAALSPTVIERAVDCLHRHAGGRIAVAGLNPHAGEGGLMGREDEAVVRPAVEACRARGIDVRGPESADSLFARARRGEFDWVLALLHDQGLIAVKTLYFGQATNWTLGLPFIRTSVDHGTAFDVAGSGKADAAPLLAVCETTCEMVAGRMPRRGAPG